MSIDVESELRAAMRDHTSTVTASGPFVDRVLREAAAVAVTTGPRRLLGRGRRRLVAIALGVLVCAVPATNLAVANGPLSYRDTFDWMFAAHVDGGPVDGPIDPATAQRVASGPGPDGLLLSVVTSRNAAGRTCITPLFETAESGLHPLPTDVVEQLGGECRVVPSALPFGRAYSLALGMQTGFYECAAGDAVRAEIRADATGQTYPVLLAYGRLFAWMPTVGDGIAGMEDAYTITGYAADGHVVGQGHLFDFTHYDKPGGRIIGPMEDENGRIITDGRSLEDPG